MKRFLFFLGVFLFGFMLLGTINFLTFISVDFDWFRQTFRPFIRFMYEPVHPIFNFFNIQDGDDARIIYPIGLSAVVWGVLGGAAGVTSVFFAIRQNDKLQPLKFMGIGTFLFIAGTLLIGNIAQESVIYRYWIWDATAIFMFMTVVAATSWIPVVRSPWKSIGLSVLTPLINFSVLLLFTRWFPEVYGPNITEWDRYPASDAVWPGGILAMVLSPIFTVMALMWKRFWKTLTITN